MNKSEATMSVLGELRSKVSWAVCGELDDERLIKALDEVFDAFEADHPGLVDLTYACDGCGARAAECSVSIRSTGPEGWVLTDDHTICPACALTGAAE